jgi:uncharacterized protein (DUF1697 family)
VIRATARADETDAMTVRMFAFIRAINTGGRRLTNTQVLEPFRSAGLADVDAYQAAGNVVFRSHRDPVELEVELGALLTDAYGFIAPTFVRTATELRSSIDDLPFPPDALTRTQGRTQITFLEATPTPAQVADALALVPADDSVVFVGRQWFWLPRAGIADSSLPVTRIERIVGTMTMRTVGTVERMLAKFAD